MPSFDQLAAMLRAAFPDLSREVAAVWRSLGSNALKEGLVAYQQGDHATARVCLELALEREPGRAEALLPLAVLCLRAGQLVLAEELLFQALGQGEARAYFHLGEVARVRQDLVTAEFFYQHAVTAEPDHARAYLRLGCTLLELDRLEEASDAFEAAVYLDRQSAAARYYLAQVSLERGDCVRALAQLHLLKSLDPASVPAHLMAAEVFERIGDLRQACCELKWAIGVGGASGILYLRLARHELALNNREAALPLFVEALSLDPTLVEAGEAIAALNAERRPRKASTGVLAPITGRLSGRLSA